MIGKILKILPFIALIAITVLTASSLIASITLSTLKNVNTVETRLTLAIRYFSLEVWLQNGTTKYLGSGTYEIKQNITSISPCIYAYVTSSKNLPTTYHHLLGCYIIPEIVLNNGTRSSSINTHSSLAEASVT